MKLKKNQLLLVFKFLFVIALLSFLVSKGFISVSATQTALSEWKKMVPAMIVMLILGPVVGVIRWRWLLAAQGIQLSFMKIAQLTFIGNFFNIALPGAVSGDFVKAYYVGQEAEANRSKAFGSILFDRLVGVSALVMVSGTALIFGYNGYANSQLLGGIRALVTIALACVVLFYTYLFLVTDHYDPLLKMLRLLDRKISKLKALTSIYEGVKQYHHHRLVVLKAILISAFIHLAVGFACLNFAQALGENQLDQLSVWVVVPLGMLVTAVPVAPAGVGTGNVAFYYFFHLIGSERGADIFSLYALGNIFVGALGGLVYFRFGKKSDLKKLEALAI